MSLSAIVCMDLNDAIGYDGQLLYKIPEDMRRFRKITMGHTVVMGKNTYMSIGDGECGLQGRVNIVLSSCEFISAYNKETNTTILNITDINKIIEDYKDSDEEVFVIGGASIYKQLLPYCSKIYMTLIYGYAEQADAFFPQNIYKEWKTIMPYIVHYSEEIGLSYSFITYERIASMTENKNEMKEITTKADVDSRADEGFDPVNHPSHYASGKIEVVDAIEDWKLDYNSGQVVKYVARAGKKYPGDKLKEIQDMEKAAWYVNRRIKQLKGEIEE